MLMGDDMISVVYMTFGYWNAHNAQWFPLSFGGFGLDVFTYIFSPYYPLSYVIKVFSGGSGAGWIPFLHFIMSFLGVYGFTRLLRFSQTACLISSIIWCCNSWVIYLGTQTGFFVATAWIPVVFWALERLLQKTSVQNLLIWAVVLGLFLLQTHFQTIYYTALVCIPYAILRLWMIWKNPATDTRPASQPFPMRPMIALAAGGILALFIASPQLAASYQMKETTSRGAGMAYEDSVFYGSLPPEELIGYYMPGVFGDWTNSRGFFEKPNPLPPHYWGRMNLRLGTDHMGLIAFVLAAVGFWFNRRNPLILFFSIFSVILALTSFGKYFFLHKIFFEIIPLYSSFRAPARLMIFVTFFVAILAGFGLDSILKAPAETLKKQFALALGVILSLLVVAALFFGFVFVTDTYFAKPPYFKGIFDEMTLAQIAPQLARAESIQTLAGYWFLAFVFVGMISTAFLLVLSKLRHAASSGDASLKNKLACALVIVVAFELIPFSKLYTRTISTDNIYYQADAITDFLVQKKNEGEIFRIFNQTSFEQFLPNKNILLGIESATGYQPTIDSRYMEVMGLMGQSPDTFNLLNVRYILLPTHLRLPEEQFSPVAEAPEKALVVYENKRVLPRFYLVGDYLLEPAPEKRLSAMLSPDVLEGRKIVLEEKPLFEYKDYPYDALENEASEKPDHPSADTSSVEVITYTADRIELKISNSNKGKLLFIGNTYSPSWHASVNGTPGKLLRANHAFQAVEIPAGKSTVILEYKNKLLQSLWIFGWSLLVICIVGMIVLSRCNSSLPEDS